MLIHEAAGLSGTTKKAVEYYCMKRLLNPEISENGYRVFSDEDVERLKKITLLRSLGISVEDIRILLDGSDAQAFQRILDEQAEELRKKTEQHALLRELAVSGDWDGVQLRAAASESRQSVAERLMNAFPGFYGEYLALHFGQFLQDPIQTAEQKEAYQEICAYLDGIRFDIPEELENETEDLNVREVFRNASEALSEAVNDPESWMENHREEIEQYLELQKTEEYRNAPGTKLKEALRQFQQEQGYSSVFIPAMRRLSDAYDAYYLKLQKADQVFLRRYPQDTDSGQ